MTRSQTGSFVFLLLFQVDFNFGILTVNIIYGMVYRLSANDSNISIGKAVGNWNVYSEPDLFRFELSATLHTHHLEQKVLCQKKQQQCLDFSMFSFFSLDQGYVNSHYHKQFGRLRITFLDKSLIVKNKLCSFVPDQIVTESRIARNRSNLTALD